MTNLGIVAAVALAAAGGIFCSQSFGQENDRAGATAIVLNAWNNWAIKTPTIIQPTKQSTDGEGCSHAVIGDGQCAVETRETVAETPVTSSPPAPETAPAVQVQASSATGGSVVTLAAEQPPALSETGVNKKSAA